MVNSVIHAVSLPPEQQAIRAKCFHPSGTFSEFTRQDIEQSIANRFEEQVRRYPDRLAVRSRSHQSTYQELNQAANRIARAIQARRRKAEQPVALLLEQGEPLFAPILGVLKSGNFFIPLEPSHPLGRTRYMLEDSEAGLIISNDRNFALAAELSRDGIQILNTDEIDRGISGDDLGLSVAPDAISCILYTSGSTGQPKGVMQTHRNNLHTSMVYAHTFNFCSEDRLTLLASVTAQAIVSIFSGLLSGASLLPLNVKEEGVASLADWLIQEEITIYHSASPLFRHFMETLTGEEEFPRVRLVRLASQTVFPSDVELYKKYFSPNCILVNVLSSTETIGLCVYFIDKNSRLATSTVPVGYPVADKEVRLVDEDGYEVGPNEVGEIVVKSRYLSPGYWGKPELTRESFLPDPDGGDQSVFHTGDVGRMLPDGCLEHLGRRDSQAKVRGFSVGLAEIEAALLGLDEVKEAVVVAQADASGNQRLAAFIVSAGKPAPTVANLRAFLTETLPSYMVPTYLVLMDSLPQLPGGKVDRLSLPTQIGGRPELQNQPVRPRNILEQKLCNIWTKVLGLDHVGVDDDFLELGGDSLLASTLMVRIGEVFQNELPLSVLIQASTVAKMADILRDEKLELRNSPLVTIQPKGDKSPFFCVGGSGGHVFGFTALSRHLGDDQPFYGLEPPGRDGEQPPLTSVEDMARLYIKTIREIQPHGPYHLGAYSWGGRVAFEMAQQFRAHGEEIAMLAMFDSGCPVQANIWKKRMRRLLRCGHFARRAFHHSRHMLSLNPADRSHYFKEKAGIARKVFAPGSSVRTKGGERPAAPRSPVAEANKIAGRKYVPRPYPGKLTYFWATEISKGRSGGPSDRRHGWRSLAKVEEHLIPGHHFSILLEPHVQTLAKLLAECLESAQIQAENKHGVA